MEIQLIEHNSGKAVLGLIRNALSKDMPLKRNGWQFQWKKLYQTEGADFYKVVLKDNKTKVQGLLMFSIMYDDMLYMNNIEVAPNNLGSKGDYEHVAGCLIAFACRKSFQLGRNAYKGFLTFESKTELIPLYQQKYGATLAIGQRMFIEPEVGLRLIDKYLK